jgi:hypothetical protein
LNTCCNLQFQREGVSRCAFKRVLRFETTKNRRLVDSDLIRCFAGAVISRLSTVPPCLTFISEKSSTHQSSTSRDHSCLKQSSTTCSFGATSRSREPSRTLARSTIDCTLHRRLGHHRLGLRTLLKRLILDYVRHSWLPD